MDGTAYILEPVDGGAGRLLEDGVWSRVLAWKNSWRFSYGAVQAPQPAPVGEVTVAVFGTSTAGEEPPSAESLRLRAPWRVMAAYRHGVLGGVYPPRVGWIVVVAMTVTPELSTQDVWVVAEQDPRGLTRLQQTGVTASYSPHGLFATPLRSQAWWDPYAWSPGGGAGSVVAVDLATTAPASSVPIPAPTVPPGDAGSAGMLAGVDVAWPAFPPPGLAGAWDPRGTWTGLGGTDPLRTAFVTPQIAPSPQVSGSRWDLLWNVFEPQVAGWDPASQVSFDQPVVVASSTWWVSTSSTPGVPMRPVLGLGDGSFVDAAAGLSVGWTHMPGLDGAGQTAFVLRRSLGVGAAQFWDAAAEAWVPGEVWNLSTAQHAQLHAGAVTNGTEPTFSVRTRGSSPVGSSWSLPATVRLVDPPAATVSIAGANSGGVVADQTPTVLSTGQPGGGASITAWQAQVLSGGGVVLEEASGAAPAPWTVGPLEPGSYIARVRVRQSGDMWSGWATTIFVVDVTPPPTPVVDAVVVTHETSGLPGLAAVVAIPTGYVPAAQMWVRVQRQTGDGPWVEVHRVAVPPGASSVTVRDWTADPAVAITYRARLETTDPDGGAVIGGWGVSAPVELSGEVARGWLSVADDPSWALRVPLSSDDAREVDLRTTQHVPIGSASWVVTGDVPTGQTGSWTWLALTADIRSALLDLLTAGRVLRYIECPEREDSGSRAPKAPPEVLRFWPTGPVSTARLVNAPHQVRHVSCPWVKA